MQKVKIDLAEMTLTNGTMVRHSNGETPYYLDLGIMENGNRVLFYYADASVIVDYIQTIIDNLPEYAAKYLAEVLNTQRDVLVRLWVVPEHDSCFEIYYDADCESNDIMDVIDWMGNHNNFACAEYRYTEIRNNHQTQIK